MTSRLHFQTHRAICNDGTKIETKQSCKLAHRGNSHGAGTTCIVGFVVILNENNLRPFSFRRVSTRKRAYRGWCSTGQNILLFNPRFFRALFSKYGNSLNTRSIGESEKERAKREGKREREGVFQSTAMDSTSITCLRCTADRCSTLFAVAWLLIPPFNDAETRVCKPCLVKWMDWYFLPSPSVRCLVRRRGFVVLSYV